MSSVRCPLGPFLIATVLVIGSTCLISGCGLGEDQTRVVETPEMRNHLEEITKSYGSDYAAKYGRKGAAKKKKQQ